MNIKMLPVVLLSFIFFTDPAFAGSSASGGVNSLIDWSIVLQYFQAIVILGFTSALVIFAILQGIHSAIGLFKMFFGN
jgi:hypothetical protein